MMREPQEKQIDQAASTSASEERTGSSDENSIEDLRQLAAQQVVDAEIPKHPVKSQDSLETLMDLAAQLLRMKGDPDDGPSTQEANGSPRLIEAEQVNKNDGLVIVQGVEVQPWEGNDAQSRTSSYAKSLPLGTKEDHFLSNKAIRLLLEQVMQHAGQDTMDTVCQAACGRPAMPQKPTLSDTQKMIEDVTLCWLCQE